VARKVFVLEGGGFALPLCEYGLERRFSSERARTRVVKWLGVCSAWARRSVASRPSGLSGIDEGTIHSSA